MVAEDDKECDVVEDVAEDAKECDVVEDDKPELSIVTFEILEAQELPEGSGKINRYVLISDVKGLVGGERRTGVCTKTMDPEWGESYTNKFNYKLSALKFKVYGTDGDGTPQEEGPCDCCLDLFGMLPKDEKLGSCELLIGKFMGQAPLGEPFELDEWLPMKLDHVEQGKLHVKASVTFNIPVVMPGTRVPLPSKFRIGLAWDFKKSGTEVDLDASLVGFDEGKKIVDKVWFKSLEGFDGAVKHSGDNRTGSGSGDDEVITVDLQQLDQMERKVAEMAVVINCYTEQSLKELKYAYLRLFDEEGKTFAFYGMGKGQVPDSTGIWLGAFQRQSRGWLWNAEEPSPSGWDFTTLAKPAYGTTVEDSLAVIMYGQNVGVFSNQNGGKGPEGEGTRLDLSLECVKKEAPADSDDPWTRLTLRRYQDDDYTGPVRMGHEIKILDEQLRKRVDMGSDCVTDCPPDRDDANTRLSFRRLDGPSEGPVCYGHVVGLFTEDNTKRLDMSTMCDPSHDSWATVLYIFGLVNDGQLLMEGLAFEGGGRT